MSNRFYIETLPIAARLGIVPLNGQTMAEWYAAQGDKPQLMLNGSLYKGSHANPIGTVMYDGRWVKDSGNGFGFGLRADGSPGFGGPWDGWRWFLSGYPGLIRQGKVIDWGFVDNSVFNASTRRSVIAARKGEILFIATRGGMTLKALVSALLDLGVEHAINLDGGGSSRLMVGGKAVNSPTDNRRIANMIVGYSEAKPSRDGITVRCTRRVGTLNAAGAVEAGRYIAPGDVCLVDPQIGQTLLIGIEYPTGAGTRRAYIKSLEGFVLC